MITIHQEYRTQRQLLKKRKMSLNWISLRVVPLMLILNAMGSPVLAFSSPSPPSSPSPVPCRDNEFRLNDATCCRRCAPGFGVVSPCVSPTNNTDCSLCVHGETFSSDSGHYKPCRACRKCPVNARVRTPCNVTHDATCECDTGFFLDTASGECRACDVCRHGWGASQPCSAKADTVCRRCPNNTYSDVHSATMVCIVCTRCAANQILLQPCSAIQDTICLGKSFGQPPPTPAPEGLYPASGAAPPAGRGPSGVDIIPIYCFLLGLIVVGLIGYVAVKHWRMCQQRKAAASGGYLSSHHGSQYGGVLTSLLDPTFAAARGSFPYHAHDPQHMQLHPSHAVFLGFDQRKTPGSDSGIFLDPDGKAFQGPLDPSTRVRDLPSIKRREIEAHLTVNLGPAYTWKQMAREMGFSTSRIAAFEMRSEREKPQLPAVRYMLSDWMKNEGATVAALQALARKFGRHDFVAVLSTHAVTTSADRLTRVHGVNAVAATTRQATMMAPTTRHSGTSPQRWKLDDVAITRPSTDSNAIVSPSHSAPPTVTSPHLGADAVTAPPSLAGGDRNSFPRGGFDFSRGGIAASAPHLEAQPKSNFSAHLGTFPHGEMV